MFLTPEEKQSLIALITIGARKASENVTIQEAAGILATATMLIEKVHREDQPEDKMFKETPDTEFKTY